MSRIAPSLAILFALHACTSRPRLLPIERANAIRYLALGDSFTIGTGSRPEQSFPARLATRWKAAGRTVVFRNLGVNGFTTDDLIAVELPQVRAFAPTLVTVAIGANDIVRGRDATAYRAKLERIFTELAASGVSSSRVIALPQPDWSIAPAATAFGSPAVLGGKIEAFNAVLREVAGVAGARYVDLFPLMRRQAQAGMLAPDGLHPSAAAYEEWASELARTLE